MNFKKILFTIATILSITLVNSHAQTLTKEQQVMLEQYKKNAGQTESSKTSVKTTKEEEDRERKWLNDPKNKNKDLNAINSQDKNSIKKTDKDKSKKTDKDIELFYFNENELTPYKHKLNYDTISVFGREIFDKENITFAPNYNIPTPSNYILGAGDQVFLELWGNTQQTFDLKISPDGNINIPTIGPVHLSGLTIAKAQELINMKLSSTNEGLDEGSVSARISLGNIRSIQVAVIGEAAAPGTYTIPSLASLFNVIYAAGGVSDIGSVRDIKLYRNGKLITTLDVYDYLLHGKNASDIRLEDNDLIVVAPYSNIVKMRGAIKRPKSYELKAGETMADLLLISGGFDGDAYTESVSINRHNGKQMEIVTLPLENYTNFALKNGDSIVIDRTSRKYANRATITGAVWRPGHYEISENVATVKDLINSADGLREKAYVERVLLSRLKEGEMTREAISLNIADILSGKSNDIKLQNGDQITINLLDSLHQQKTLSVLGEVNKPTEDIPYIENLTIADALVIANGLKESASLARLEVVRRIKDPKSTQASTRKAEVFSFEIPEDLFIESEASKFKLMPFDEIFVRRSPSYNEQEAVFIEGQVIFPGQYALNTTQDRLSDLVKYAGGLAPQAYINGASLKRKMSESDIERVKAVAKMMDGNLNNSRDTMKLKLEDLTASYSIGINLQEALNNPGSDANIVLQEGDQLTVPEYNNIVKINGAVYFPNAVAYNPKLKLNDYVDMAGGYTTFARRKAFIIYMNGTVAVSGNGKRIMVEPGCEIIVPSKPMKAPATLGEIVGITSSTVSMLALIANLFRL